MSLITARRALAGIAILGLLIALVVIQQRRGDAPAAGLVDGALPPIDGAGTVQQAAPAAAPATVPPPSSASTTGSDDESDGMCEQILDAAAEFALLERNAANPVQTLELSDDQETAEHEALLRSLAGSPDSEHFLAAHLIEGPWRRVSDDASAYAQLLELGLRAADSGSPLLAWHALWACAEVEEYCPFPHLEQSLLETDRDNAEAWAMVATLRHRRGDIAGALAAMQGAARASTATWYWTETIALIERSLPERTLTTQAPIPESYRLATAFANSSALPSQSSLRDMCSQESASNRAWGEACLAFGNLRWEHNETDFARLYAYRIREEALTALGDTERVAAVKEEFAMYSAERTVFAGPAELWQALIETSPERLDAYLSAIQESGEVEGLRQFYRQELPPLLERAGLLERDGAQECIVRFFDPAAAVETLSATFRDYPVEDYPIQIGDQLQIVVRGQNRRPTSLQVGPDGMVTLPRVPGIAAVGKTTGQLEREIATMLSEPDSSPEVFVFLLSPRSPEELQLEFDDALREAAEGRRELR